MRDTNSMNDVMTKRPSWSAGVTQDAGAFQVEKHGDESIRLTMREPHFANNVRYTLVVGRTTKGALTAHWNDAEDARPCSWLEVGIA